MQSPERLNKFLALHLGISRREADEYIQAGRVTVGGELARLGVQVKPDDIVTVDGEPLATKTAYLYLLFNKPIGYVCSRKKQGDAETIYALLPEKYYHLKPVGRLDKDSSGLILLTNDGNLAHQMTHPKFYKTKIYEIELDRELEPLHQQMINDYGVQLEDGPSKLLLGRVSETSRQQWRVTMTEGRNRQIRRTFAALGYEVVQLHRITFGNYSLGDLEAGEYRELSVTP